MKNENVIKVNGNPDTSNTVTTIPPGFLPMPAMVTVPILGHTARIQPIAGKENTEGKIVGPCREIQ